MKTQISKQMAVSHSCVCCLKKVTRLKVIGRGVRSLKVTASIAAWNVFQKGALDSGPAAWPACCPFGDLCPVLQPLCPTQLLALDLLTQLLLFPQVAELQEQVTAQGQEQTILQRALQDRAAEVEVERMSTKV